MPGGDGTGPMGQGPTGWGRGPCGKGMGRGFGMGFRCRYVQPASLTKDEEKKVLKAELDQIEAEKKDIEKKLKEMK